jgi:hypothetical protein
MVRCSTDCIVGGTAATTPRGEAQDVASTTTVAAAITAVFTAPVTTLRSAMVETTTARPDAHPPLEIRKPTGSMLTS